MVVAVALGVVVGAPWVARAMTSAPAVVASSNGAVAKTPSEPSGARGTGSAAPSGTTRVSMRNVDFFVDPEIALHVRHLDGSMRSIAGGPVIFDDKTSFIIKIDDAEVGLSAKGLSALLNKYVFAYRGAPLKRLELTVQGNEILQRGILHKGVDLPFEITATLDVTPDGLIRLHPVKTKILGVNGAKLMKLFGLSLEKLLDLRGAKGASVRGNDLFLEPDSILPPPIIHGRVTAVRIEGDQVIQVFGPAAGETVRRPLVPPDAKAPNYMFYKGGTLRFGKMLMLEAEMQIVDLDPADPFAFDLDRYNSQLIAGYSRTLPDLGLEVHMRDIDKVSTEGATRAPVGAKKP